MAGFWPRKRTSLFDGPKNVWNNIFDWLYDDRVFTKWTNTSWGKVIRIPVVLFISCPLSLVLIFGGAIFLTLRWLLRFIFGEWK